MAEYTFFTNPMSRGQIARWALHEVGADYETKLVDWSDKPEALIKYNPLGKVPTLVHNHQDHVHVVTEAAAICHYLAEMHPEADLLPQEHEKAAYYRRMFYAAGPLEQALVAKAMGWRPDDPSKEVMLGYGSFEKAIDTLATLISDRKFACGDRFTMADVYVGSHVAWGLQFGTMPRRAVFEDYAARINERTALQEARAIDEQLIAEAQDG